MSVSRGPRYRIAVCGAGTAGLAASAFLADFGHDVALFDRFAAPRPIGAGLLLQPTGLACLACLGIERTVVDLGARIDRLYGETVNGRRVLDMGYADLSPGIFGIGIHRASLFAALKDAADRRGVRIVPDTELVETSLVGSAGGRAGGRVITEASGRRHGPFDLVVDATGARSVLRRALDAGLLERPFRYSALWCPVPLPTDWPDHNRLTQRYQSASVMIGVLPIGRLPGKQQQLAALFWSMPAGTHDAWRAEGLSRWKDRVRDLWPATAGLLDAIATAEDLSLAAYVDVTLSPSVGDRLVIIGDAAHATSPQLGQGANLALADALFLARSLEETADLASGLAAFQNSRRRHVLFYQRASRWLTPFFQSDSRIAGAVRDLTFGPSSYLGLMRRQMVEVLCGIKTGPLGVIDPRQWEADYARLHARAPPDMERGRPDRTAPI